jgi:hypothetical protein
VPIFLQVDRQLDQLLIDSIYTVGKSFFLLLERVRKALQLRTTNLLIQQVYFLIEIFADIDERLKHDIVCWFGFHAMLAMKRNVINSRNFSLPLRELTRPASPVPVFVFHIS